LSQTHIGRGLMISKVNFRRFGAEYMDVDGPATFEGVGVSDYLSLAHSRFQVLTIDKLNLWEQTKELSVDLEGLSFGGVDVPEDKVDEYSSKMLSLLNSERVKHFSPQPYTELESFLRAHGNPQMADRVYIDMRRRERRELVWWKWGWDWLLDVLVGYGRKPWRAALVFVGFALVGVAIFHEDRMEPQELGHVKLRYSPFWYSLDLLAPVIDLGPAKDWRPKQEQFWIRNYAYFHRISGWILVPLVLAAITGIIK